MTSSTRKIIADRLESDPGDVALVEFVTAAGKDRDKLRACRSVIGA